MNPPDDPARAALIYRLKSKFRFEARATVAMMTVTGVEAMGAIYFFSQGDETGYGIFAAAAAVGAFIGAYLCSEDRDRAAEQLVVLGEEVPSHEDWLPTAIVTALIAGVASVLVAVIGG